MNIETTGTGRRWRFVKRGAAAAFLLVAYAVGLVGFAAHSSGVELAWSPAQEPLPPYKIGQRANSKRSDRFWVSVAENTVPTEMERIVGHLVQTEYSGNSRMVVFFYVGRDTTESRTTACDASFVWTLTGGVRQQRIGGPSSDARDDSGAAQFPGRALFAPLWNR